MTRIYKLSEKEVVTALGRYIMRKEELYGTREVRVSLDSLAKEMTVEIDDVKPRT